MKIVSSAPVGVAFGADDYNSTDGNFVLFWNRYTGDFKAGFNAPGNSLHLVENPDYAHADSYSEAKKVAEKFFEDSKSAEEILLERTAE